MAQAQLQSWKLATASPSLHRSSLPVSSYAATFAAQSGSAANLRAPQAEWAEEAKSNLRHVVSGVGFAFIIEAAFALCIFAIWNLWHIR
jgi:hypothetical protein